MNRPKFKKGDKEVHFTILHQTSGTIDVVWIHRVLPVSNNKVGERLRKIINRQLAKKNLATMKGGDFANGTNGWTSDPTAWTIQHANKPSHF